MSRPASASADTVIIGRGLPLVRANGRPRSWPGDLPGVELQVG